MTEPCSSIESRRNHENPYIYCHAALKKKRMNNVNRQDNYIKKAPYLYNTNSERTTSSKLLTKLRVSLRQPQHFQAIQQSGLRSESTKSLNITLLLMQQTV